MAGLSAREEQQDKAVRVGNLNGSIDADLLIGGYRLARITEHLGSLFESRQVGELLFEEGTGCGHPGDQRVE